MQKIYQVDTFTDQAFRGNPAGVCPLEEWLPDNLMQDIATEMNLSETAFFVATDKGNHIRWFTPTTEVRFCGHATLASAHIIFEELGHDGKLYLETNQVGELIIERIDGKYVMDFPSDDIRQVSHESYTDLIQAPILDAYVGATDLLLRVSSESEVRDTIPNILKMKTLDQRAVIVTAEGDGDLDFVSRVFAPAVGIDEDPVTGSAHTTLTPFWAKTLEKNKMQAAQISQRLGKIGCTQKGDRVILEGHAVTIMEGIVRV